MNAERAPVRSIERRVALRRLGALAFAAAMTTFGGRLGRAAPAETRALLDKLSGGKAMVGRIRIEMAEIAENGSLVPITLKVDSPMSEAEHVRRIILLAERNPAPQVAEFALSPACGKAEVQLRVRLAESQTLHALAELSDGSLWRAERAVQVTVGGCAG